MFVNVLNVVISHDDFAHEKRKTFEEITVVGFLLGVFSLYETLLHSC